MTKCTISTAGQSGNLQQVRISSIVGGTPRRPRCGLSPRGLFHRGGPLQCLLSCHGLCPAALLHTARCGQQLVAQTMITEAMLAVGLAIALQAESIVYFCTFKTDILMELRAGYSVIGTACRRDSARCSQTECLNTTCSQEDVCWPPH